MSGRRRPRLAIVSLLISAAMLTACYPIHKTLQPAATVTVRDQGRQPIPGARVTLITNYYPYGREFSRDSVLTDSVGVAHFVRRAEWQTEVLMIHGAKIYFWNWCVERPGFATFDTGKRPRSNFDPVPTVTLSPGPSTPCESRSY